MSEQPCNKSDNFDKVVTSCQQVVPNLLTTCDKQCEYILLTACEQTCNKLVRFYVCSVQSESRIVGLLLVQNIKSLAAPTHYAQVVTNLKQTSTHAKISHLATSQQVVFALLVPSCQQVWNKLLTICNNLVDIIRLVTRLFQQVQYSHHIAILLQPCVVNLVTFLLYHDCIRLVRTTL